MSVLPVYLEFAKFSERTFEGVPIYGGGGRRYYIVFVFLLCRLAA